MQNLQTNPTTAARIVSWFCEHFYFSHINHTLLMRFGCIFGLDLVLEGTMTDQCSTGYIAQNTHPMHKSDGEQSLMKHLLL